MSFQLSYRVEKDKNRPIIAWQNILSRGNISASTGNGRLMGTPDTVHKWVADDDSNQSIAVDTNGRAMDYIGIAKHTLRGAEIEILADVDGETIQIVEPQKYEWPQAIIFTFDQIEPDFFTVFLRDLNRVPGIAVLRAGVAMRAERNIYVGHTPLPFNREFVSRGRYSEAGEFLGQRIKRKELSASVDMQNITTDFYRRQFDPFFAARSPFFFSWRPHTYPFESGYCWLSGDPQVRNDQSNGMMSVSFEMRGIGGEDSALLEGIE